MLPAIAIAVALVGACGTPKRTSNPEEWSRRAEVDGDFDKAEDRWRREIAANPWSEDDMNLLTDDPPGAPDSYGSVTAADPALSGGAVSLDDPPAEGAEESDEFWSDVGKAGFSAFTVLFTVGIAVAPYLLL